MGKSLIIQTEIFHHVPHSMRLSLRNDGHRLSLKDHHDRVGIVSLPRLREFISNTPSRQGRRNQRMYFGLQD